MNSEEGWEPVLAGIQERINQLRHIRIEGGDLADAAGMIRRMEVDLQRIRWALNDQASVLDAVEPARPVDPTPWTDRGTVRAVGQKFQMVETRSAKRTYRTAAILSGVATATGSDPFVVLAEMHRFGAAKVSFTYTKLVKYLNGKGVRLKAHTVDHAVDDDGQVDAPWMGEVWESKFAPQAIEE